MQSSVKREYIKYLIKFIEIRELEKEYRIYLHIVLFGSRIVLEWFGTGPHCKSIPVDLKNRFKSCFDTARLKISTSPFRIRVQISKRSIGRRAVVILLQEKNFGPNVIYYVSTFIDTSIFAKNIKL